MILSPSDYASLVRERKPLSSVPTNLFGRVIQIYPTDPDDPTAGTLNTLPSRRVGWVGDGESLLHLSKVTPEEYFVHMGKKPDWLAGKRAPERFVKLYFLVFEACESILADWNGLRAAVRKFHPQVAGILEPYWTDLQRPMTELFTPEELSELESERVKEDVSNSMHMSEERLVAAPVTLKTAREFLLHTLGANSGYRGDGLVAGSTFREYLIPNLPVLDLGEVAVLDLHALSAG